MKYYSSSPRFVYEFLPPEIGQITNSNPIPLDSPIIGFLRVSPKMKQRREKKKEVSLFLAYVTNSECSQDWLLGVKSINYYIC